MRCEGENEGGVKVDFQVSGKINWMDGSAISWRKSGFQRKEQELSLGHIKFEVPLKSFSGNVKELIGYRSGAQNAF